jgi:large subunit ribosomal protein L23
MVIQRQHISEKATVMADKFNQIVFQVLPSATKLEIKQAVEHLFNVKVMNVSVINLKGKYKRYKQKLGKRSDWKKAFVCLEKDYDIDFTGIE